MIRRSGRPVRIWQVLALLTLCGLFSVASFGQTIDGKWTATWRVLDNGESDRLYLDLHQTATQVTGTAATIGHAYQVDGTMIGNHFKLALLKGGNGGTVAGDLVGNQLHITFEGAEVVASAARREDEYPPYGHIEPPALVNLPWNGLAKTPPMGWTSWNAFESRIDDKMVREMTDEMVKNGMRDAGYTYVNIDDTWEGVRDARDLWKHENIVFQNGVYVAKVSSHGTLMLRVSGGR